MIAVVDNLLLLICDQFFIHISACVFSEMDLLM